VDAHKYSRFIRLAGVQDEGFEKVRNARIVLVGIGTLGGAYALNLVRMGTGFIRLVDRDIVEEHNLSTQLLYDMYDVQHPLPKVTAAKNRLNAINQDCEIEACPSELRQDNAEELLGGVDLIIDATDNFETRFLINDVAVKLNIPWIYTGVVGYTGVCMAIIPGVTACLRCMMERVPDTGELPTCETAGVWAAAAQTITAVGLTEALRIITDGKPEFGLSELDIQAGTWKKVHPERSGDCPVCVHHEYSYLSGKTVSQSVKLCGREMVHISPGRQQNLNLPGMADLLPADYECTCTEDLLHIKLPEAEIYLFKDGRSFVKGVSDTERAKSIFNRYISV